ncbi:hypothetical protein Nepgr_011216 [Nepenthes gracilis]|uniref:Uncharacterized protein n=1 Tax=Nepenthes gracilis TaxID=150966 RepID=A0AAD3XM38_NEPGR|nr:hypothetical protein Nepgr_011216 [Nepenthes gracilis]
MINPEKKCREICKFLFQVRSRSGAVWLVFRRRYRVRLNHSIRRRRYRCRRRGISAHFEDLCRRLEIDVKDDYRINQKKLKHSMKFFDIVSRDSSPSCWGHSRGSPDSRRT